VNFVVEAMVIAADEVDAVDHGGSGEYR
jgi:hypothetical protein